MGFEVDNELNPSIVSLSYAVVSSHCPWGLGGHTGMRRDRRAGRGRPIGWNGSDDVFTLGRMLGGHAYISGRARMRFV